MNPDEQRCGNCGNCLCGDCNACKLSKCEGKAMCMIKGEPVYDYTETCDAWKPEEEGGEP